MTRAGFAVDDDGGESGARSAGHRRNGSRDGADGDLAVLTAAAEQLFASSATFEEPALLSLLDAVLRGERPRTRRDGRRGREGARVARRAIVHARAHGGRAPGQRASRARPLAHGGGAFLQRRRVGDVRRALSRRVRGTRQSRVRARRRRVLAESDADAVERLGVETYEIAVLTPLPRLMAGAVAPEARLGALNVLLSILRDLGEKITSGWRVVLSTLAAAAAMAPRGGAVSLGWSAVSVVVSDLLPHVPDGVLTEVTTTVAAYARPERLGTSLTAQSAHVVDTRAIFSVVRVEEMRSPQAGAFMAEMTIVPLFSALRDASVDPRPEVRNSGVRTLVNTLASPRR